MAKLAQPLPYCMTPMEFVQTAWETPTVTGSLPSRRAPNLRQRNVLNTAGRLSRDRCVEKRDRDLFQPSTGSRSGLRPIAVQDQFWMGTSLPQTGHTRTVEVKYQAVKHNEIHGAWQPPRVPPSRQMPSLIQMIRWPSLTPQPPKRERFCRGKHESPSHQRIPRAMQRRPIPHGETQLDLGGVSLRPITLSSTLAKPRQEGLVVPVKRLLDDIDHWETKPRAKSKLGGLKWSCVRDHQSTLRVLMQRRLFPQDPRDKSRSTSPESHAQMSLTKRAILEDSEDVQRSLVKAAKIIEQQYLDSVCQAAPQANDTMISELGNTSDHLGTASSVDSVLNVSVENFSRASMSRGVAESDSKSNLVLSKRITTRMSRQRETVEGGTSAIRCSRNESYLSEHPNGSTDASQRKRIAKGERWDIRRHTGVTHGRDTLLNVSKLRLVRTPTGQNPFGMPGDFQPDLDTVLGTLDPHTATTMNLLSLMYTLPSWKHTDYDLVWNALDHDGVGWIGPVHLCCGLKTICGERISSQELDYIGEVLNLKPLMVTKQEFKMAAALAELIVGLVPFVRTHISREKIADKKEKAVMMFFVDADRDCRLPLDDLSALLDAGHVPEEKQLCILEELEQRCDSITFLEYLAYMPLFVDVHHDIVEHTFGT